MPTNRRFRMLEQSFHPPSSRLDLTETEIQAWAEQLLQPIRDLQELPLILVPTWPLPSLIEADIETWLKQAHLEDQRLRIERRVIPHTPILIPDTARGRQLFNLAKAIADIPLEAAVFPTNQNQGYWFKTLHYYWQAQGVVIAQRLLGVISDPLAQDGVLTERLADQNLAFLRLSRDIDRACFRLLVRGSRWIKAWASKKNIPYPFKSPQELFLELLKERFLLMWQLGPLSSEKKPLSKAQQREHFAVRLRLLKQSPWLEQQEGKRQSYRQEEQQYLDYLAQAGWSGRWLLALRPHSDEKQIAPYWDAYVAALSKSKPLAADPLDWLKGQPWHRSSGNVLRPVEATIDLLGCIHWQDVANRLTAE